MYHPSPVDCSSAMGHFPHEPLASPNRAPSRPAPAAPPCQPICYRVNCVNENVLDVLIYIYENYMDSEEDAAPPDQVMLEEELLQAGFPKLEVNKAFDWLDELAWRQGSLSSSSSDAAQSIRIFTEDEQQRIDLETQGMLLYLTQVGILDLISRELVIERAMALDADELSADDVKWIILLVLLNQPGQESAFALMEELVYNGEPGYLH